jgi:hypothetical protein
MTFDTSVGLSSSGLPPCFLTFANMETLFEGFIRQFDSLAEVLVYFNLMTNEVSVGKVQVR